MNRLLVLFLFLISKIATAQFPTATVVASGTTCFGSCSASASVAASGGNAPYSYFWMPSGGTSTVATGLCGGTYTCMVTDSDGRTVTAVAVIAQPPPIQLNITSSAVNCSNIGSATVSAFGSSSPYNYFWPQIPSTSSVLSNVASGIYTVFAGDNLGCLRGFTVNIPSSSTGSFLSITGPSTLCGNSVVTLSVSGGNNYLWNNAVTASVSSYYISNAASQYTAAVSVTGTNAITGCTATAIHTMQVYKPNVAVTGPTNICQYHSTTLTASGAQNYFWNSSIISPSVVISPSSAVSFSVIGTDAFGCSDTAFHNISVSSSPTLAVNSGSICAGQSFVINPSFAPFGFTNMTVTTGSSSLSMIASSFTVSPATTQQYSISVGPLLGCASTVAVSNVSVSPAPSVSAPSGSMCSGSVFTIQATGASSYVISGNNFTVSPPANTTYTLSGTNTLGCISAPALVNVTVVPLPTVSVASGSICSGSSFAISPAGGNTYSISGGSNIVSPANTSTYSVVAYNNGCASVNTAIATVSVYPSPTIAASGGSMCVNQSFVINASGTASLYTNAPSLTVSPISTTSYSVFGISPDGCLSSNTVVVTVTVHSLPLLSINGGTSTCQGSPVILTANGANTYTWNNQSTNTTNIVSPSISTSYTVTGTSSVGCIGSGTHNITVYALPPLTASLVNPMICMGQTTAINASGAPSITISGTVQNGVPFSPSQSSSYTVTGINSNSCISQSILPLTVNALPNLSVSPGHALSLCKNETATVSASGAFSYSWNTGVAGSVLTLTAGISSVYVVTGTDANGCQDTLSIKLIVNSCTGLRDELIEVEAYVFPNPGTGKFVVHMNGPFNAVVFDMAGKKILEQKSIIKQTELDISNYSNGVYLLEIEGVTKTQRIKLVKQ